MPRLLGVDLPSEKRTEISLRYLYGIGPTLARELCTRASIDPGKRARDLTDDELARIANLLDNDYIVEGQLRRVLGQNVGRLKDIACSRGVRHRRSPQCRGQRPRTNARTRKGPRKTVAGKRGDKDRR